MLHSRHILTLLIACLMLTACRSSRTTQSSEPTTSSSSPTTNIGASAASYATKIAKVKVNQTCITASAKVKLTGLGKDLSVNAQLRMKRDDVVRLSLRFIGMEVGLMEFTPQDVLIVDRINKRYVRASYNEVSFLKTAELDFYSLQSLFWNELFIPGQRNTVSQAARFSLSQSDNKPVLTLTDTPRLTYAFTTNSAQSVVEQLLVKGNKSNDRGQFTWTYADFKQFAGRLFPTEMHMQATDAKKSVGMDLELSNLKNDSDWNTRTTISAKYSRLSIEEVLKGLNF